MNRRKRFHASHPSPLIPLGRSALYDLSVRRLTGLTEASFPRDLTIPQLLLSIVWITLPLIQRDLMTVFTPRGLSPSTSAITHDALFLGWRPKQMNHGQRSRYHWKLDLAPPYA